ncbi:uncharacterized protein LOC116207440 isoform X2 [Punica granatum]|uniref:Uncharacterized protein LOC116207440 isoform X2 n=1 Tax=Punica granatum TaxID=22663 RepID=A0A6P8DG16_PUNGR|nr:uncharacterized protein LOC116207440 isoform X2 [Punica granatum]
MAFFASCWLIIELYLIPDGLLKWFYLSFYLHPLLLIACQFFLWLKALKEFLSVILLFFLNSVNCLCIYIYNFFMSSAVYCFSFIRVRGYCVHSRETFGPAESSDEDYQVFRSFSFSCQATSTFELKVFPAQAIDYREEDENEYAEALMDFRDSNKEPKPNRDIDTNADESLYFSSACCSNLPVAKDLVLPYVFVNEHGTHLTSPTVIWRWPESLPPDGGTSYSLEEEVSDLDKYIPSPYEHISLAGMDMNKDLASQYRTGPTDFPCSELEWIDNEPTVNVGSNTILLVREEPDTTKDSDPFYEKYSERMRWFDVLSYERTCGISAILEKQFDPATISNPYISCGKTAKKRLLKSLESDFELVYVAQMCLSWEALHHQYRKVQELLLSSSSPQVRVSGHTKLVGEFQNFQVLIERFLEDERCGGKRYLKFAQGRFSLKSLLQVPELSGNPGNTELSGSCSGKVGEVELVCFTFCVGFSVVEEEPTERESGAVLELKEVAKAMENCIKAFYLFVKTDKDKSWWKLKSSLWSYPPVEDPRDLQLLDELTERHQKVLLLKDLQGKGKCRIKRGGWIGESQRKEVLFTMIDLKLVSRVLQMATISSSQLKWCQSKLGNINFQDGKVTRGCVCPLFPAS